MSDEEYDFDDDDEYIDDVPYNEAEDLAAHTAQSPVLINYDPLLETTSYPSDWEYYSDEFWEQLPSKRRKLQDHDGSTGKAVDYSRHTKNKQRGATSKQVEKPPDGQPILGASGIIWKSKEDRSYRDGRPIVEEGQLEKVSILKDWRDRFKTRVTSKSLILTMKEAQWNGLAHESKNLSDEDDADALPPPPMSLDQARESLAKLKRIVKLPSNDFMQSYETPSSHLCNDPFDTDDNDSALDVHVNESTNSKEAVNQQETATHAEGVTALEKGLGRPGKRKYDGVIEDSSNECPNEPTQSATAPIKKRKMGRPKTKQSLEPLDDVNAKHLTESSSTLQDNGYIEKTTKDDAGSAAEDTKTYQKARQTQEAKLRPCG